MLFRHVRVEELHQISFDYFFVWKLILGTSMVEERSLVKHRLKRLLDQSDLDTLVLCEDWLRNRLAASREPRGFNRNPTGSKDRCAVCRVCGGHRPGSNTAEEKEPWNTTVLATGEVVSRGAVCVPCRWSKDRRICPSMGATLSWKAGCAIHAAVGIGMWQWRRFLDTLNGWTDTIVSWVGCAFVPPGTLSNTCGDVLRSASQLRSREEVATEPGLGHSSTLCFPMLETLFVCRGCKAIIAKTCFHTL